MQVTNVKADIITELIVPKNLIEISQNYVRIFALDSKTIGLSNHPPDFWSEQALWEGKIALTHETGGYSLLLPQEILSFYQPRRIEISGDVNKNRVLLFTQIEKGPMP